MIYMLTDDYVSFETAKLLKEKGFDEKCIAVYHDGELELVSSLGIFSSEGYGEQILTYTNSECEWSPIMISAPTLQMAMKWLREVHNLVIEPYRTACGYLYTISNIPYGSTKHDNGDDEDSGQWSTWEKVCEDGIKYCLENLI